MPTASRLVLLHGFALDGRAWSRQLAAFPQAIAPDVPGFGSRQLDGEADVSELEALLDGAHLVGHSLGAAVAVDLALRLPQRLRSLTLANPLLLGRSGNIAAWPACVARSRQGDLDGARAAWLGDPLFAELGDAARADVHRIVADYRCGHWAGRTTTGFRFADPLPLLGRLVMPILILTASRDLPGFQAMAAEYSRLLPHARTVTLDAAHMAPCEIPERWNAVVGDFARG